MFIVGSQRIRFPDPAAIPEAFRGLVNCPAPESDSAPADMTIEFTPVDKSSWHSDRMSKADNCYSIERPGHKLICNLASLTISVTYISSLSKTDIYWLQRDLFATIGSLSLEPVLHSSSVIAKKEGYIFCASSGTGKSTIARNLTKARYANANNDETNWLYFNREGELVLLNQHYYMQGHGLPQVPVKGVYILQQSPSCHITDDVSRIEAFSYLLAVHCPFDTTDPLLEKRSESIKILLDHISVRRLHLNLNPVEIASTLFSS